MTKRIGLQLYSIKEFLPEDFWGTLEKVKACGFNAVEFAGYYDHSAKELKVGLEKLGLEPLSSHVGFDLLRNTPDEVVSFSQELGLSYVVCPGAPLETLEQIETATDVFKTVAEKLQAVGIGFGYHNHDREFRTLDGGRMIQDILLEKGQEYGLLAEIDTCWATVGGVDAAEYIHGLGTQAGPLHFKDLNKDYDPEKRNVDTILGTGVVDFERIIKDGEASGILEKGIVVEQEDFEGDPFEELKAAVDYIHRIW